MLAPSIWNFKLIISVLVSNGSLFCQNNVALAWQPKWRLRPNSNYPDDPVFSSSENYKGVSTENNLRFKKQRWD